jgi:peptidoglycan/LPS O-acetylase OafA/YrhL
VSGPYRSDVDGLRAVAVLAVVAFHIQFTAFPGGYIGVDVFFVISGYLIGSIILEEMDAGRFSFLGFYERRVRRIFPALAVLLLLLSIPAYMILLPGELVSYGQSVLAATFSLSNFYFLVHTGYFSAPAYNTPLLHTWSLAIEEQFYLFLPIFLALLHGLRRRRLALVTLAAALLSFALALHQVRVAREDAFFLPWTRAWELLLGTLVAQGLLPVPGSALGRNITALAGLLLILVPAAAYSTETPFPGLAALPPCAGAALIIAAGRGSGSAFGGSHVGRLLAWRPLAFIGKISYSLYLWHWPVIVFLITAGLGTSIHQSALQKILAVLASLALATLSWRYVETPFRRGPRRPARRRLFTEAALAATVLAMLGFGAMLTRGLPGRFSPEAATVAGYIDYDWRDKGYFRIGSCFLDSGLAYGPFLAQNCMREDAGRPSDLILGDSHAAHLWYGLSTAFPEINFLQATAPYCKPFLAQPAAAAPYCRRMTRYVFEDFLTHHKVERLILAAAWSEGDLGPLAGALDWARTHRIPAVVVGPIVLYDEVLPRLLFLSLRDGDPDLVGRHRLKLEALDAKLRGLAAAKGAAYISLIDALCQAETCTTFAAPGVPLQFDIAHLTAEGSVWLAKRLRELKALP